MATIEEEEEDYSKRFRPERLTSEVYGTDNIPKDWADVALLVPHEIIRREMTSMIKSIDMLVERISQNTMESWHAILFCEWIIDIFVPFIHEHHTIEEEIYFPWIMTKIDIPTNKDITKDHKELIASLDEISTLCNQIINKEKKGIDCKIEVTTLKTKIHSFEIDMKQHLMEEERDIPPLARKEFTSQDEKQVIKKIIKKSKFSILRSILPSMIYSIEDWGTTEYLMEFQTNELPKPLMYLVKNYYNPDFDTYIKPKRDAPFLDIEPKLKQRGCCGLSFCFRCIC